MNKILGLILILFGCINVMGFNINGVVIGIPSNQPVVAAECSLIVNGTDSNAVLKTVATDEMGGFSITHNDSISNIVLRIHKDGYEYFSKEIINPEGDI